MVELIKNEIGDNKISNKVGDIQWLEKKIKESYKEIYESKAELQDLKSNIAKNLSGKEFKTMLENEVTIDHVKNVLNQAIGKFESLRSGATDKDPKELAHVSFMDVYGAMGAGLVFNMQLGLAKLGCTFQSGIDGMYGSKDTTVRVKEFQNAWNVSHPTDSIAADGWAGEQTLKRMILALNDTKRDKTLIGQTPTETQPAPDKKEKEEKKNNNEENKEEDEELTSLTEDDALEDLEKYHLTDDGKNLTPMPGYKWVDKKDMENFATVLRNKPKKEEKKKEEETTNKEKEEENDENNEENNEDPVDKTKEEDKTKERNEKKEDTPSFSIYNNVLKR